MIDLNDIKFTEMISALSAIISLCSMGIAGFALKTSRQSAQLSQKIYSDGQPQLNLELLSAHKSSNEKFVLIALEILITNPKDKENALKRTELRIDYVTDGIVGNLLLPASDDKFVKNLIDAKPRISETERLPACATSRGWLTFRIDKRTWSGIDVNQRFLILTDAANQMYTLQVISLNEFGA